MSSCQIITNNRGEILGVNAPNGQPSILFEEGYKYLSGEDYVNIKDVENKAFGISNEGAYKLVSELQNNGLMKDVSFLPNSEFENSEKFILRDGNMFINEDEFTPDTKISELSELFYEKLKNHEPVTFEQGLAQVEKSLLDLNSPLYKIQNAENFESFKTTEGILKTLMGQDGLIFKDLTKNSRAGLANWVRKQFKSIQKWLGIKSDIDGMTVKDLVKEKGLDIYIGKKQNLNEQESKQYADEAANYVGVAQSAEFKAYADANQILTDVNGEPLLSEVIAYERNKPYTFSIGQQISISKLSNTSDGVLAYKDAFLDVNGDFKIDEKQLRDSGIFTESEIANFLDNPPANLEQIVRHIDKVETSSFDSEVSFSLLDEFDELGFQKTMSVDEFIKDAVRSGRQIDNGSQYENFLDSLPSNVSDAIRADETINNYIKEKLLRGRKIDIKIMEDGEVVDKLERDVANEIKETLILDEGNVDNWLLDIDSLLSFSYDVLLSDTSNVHYFLDRISEQAIDFNIDLTDLKKRANEVEIEETVEFLQSLRQFASEIRDGSLTDSDIENFADAYSDFFNLSNDFVVDNSSLFQGRNVVKFDNSVADTTAFQRGYVRLQGDYFTKVDKNITYQQAVKRAVDAYFDRDVKLFKDMPDFTKESQIENWLRDRFKPFLSQSTIKKLGDDAYLMTFYQNLMSAKMGEHVKTGYTQTDIDNFLRLKELIGTEAVIQDLVNNFPAAVQKMKLRMKLNPEQYGAEYDKVAKWVKIVKDGVSLENKSTLSILKNLVTDNKIFKTLQKMFTKDVGSNTLTGKFREELSYVKENMENVNSMEDYDYEQMGSLIRVEGATESFLTRGDRVYYNIKNTSLYQNVTDFENMTDGQLISEFRHLDENFVKEMVIQPKLEQTIKNEENVSKQFIDEVYECR
jgi:hypothetical protein|nr:MAG TPA: hypothetical protein [Caudoviricetes sp.]